MIIELLSTELGIIIRLKDKPYECGDASPRINIISKTIEEFVVAAEKLSYSMFFESFKDAAPSLSP